MPLDTNGGLRAIVEILRGDADILRLSQLAGSPDDVIRKRIAAHKNSDEELKEAKRRIAVFPAVPRDGAFDTIKEVVIEIDVSVPIEDDLVAYSIHDRIERLLSCRTIRFQINGTSHQRYCALAVPPNELATSVTAIVNVGARYLYSAFTQT